MDFLRSKLIPKKKVLIAIAGSIAAYKIPELVSGIQKRGVEVRTILTPHATHFVSPLVLETLTGFPARSSLFSGKEPISGTEHIELARWADLLVFVPATANLITKLALGFADDLPTTIALATRAPRLIAPAMNTVMWENQIIQNHIQTLTQMGASWVPPEAGTLACKEEGIGKLATLEAILSKIFLILNKQDSSPRMTNPSLSTLSGKKILITAGPTKSHIDAVRYLTNPSTGQMGAALAEEALRRGAQVFYILGVDKGVVRPTALPGEESLLQISEVETAEEMRDAALEFLPKADGVIATAAVLDYRIKQPADKKIKRGSNPIQLELIPSVDVLSVLRKRATARQWFFGFAAETDSVEHHGIKKLKTKNLDFLFANQIARIGSVLKTGFGVPTNAGILFRKRKKPMRFALMSKTDLAIHLWNAIEEDLK